MDRFVTTLRGVKREKIKRTSLQSAATMKEEGATLRGYVTISDILYFGRHRSPFLL